CGVAEAGIDASARFGIFDGVVAADPFKLAPDFFACVGAVVEPEELGFQTVALKLKRPGLFGAEATEAERGRALVIEDDGIERFDRVDFGIAAVAAGPLRREDRTCDDDQAAGLFGDPALE